jgi:antitoxin YefM
MLHAGLDLSRKRLDVCLLAEHGELVEEFAVPPDADGLRGLVRRVGDHGARPYGRAMWAETVGPATPTRGRSLSRWETAYTMRYTLLVAKTVPVREFRTNLSALLSDVADRRDHVLVTRNGKPAAVLVPIDEYDALEETAEILSDSETLAAIETGLAELSRGEVVTLADLRAELDAHRSTR